MFFLKHVLPLVIISVLIGYVAARIGLPPPDNREEAASDSRSQLAGVTTQPETSAAATEYSDILSRVREAVSESSLGAKTDDQGIYTGEINSEIEAYAEKWSTDTLPGQADTSQQSTEPQQRLQANPAAAESGTTAEPETAAMTETEPPVELIVGAEVTEPASPAAEGTVTTGDVDVAKAESESPVVATSETDETGKAVSIAMAESSETANDATLATEVAGKVAAEIDEQASTRAPETLAAISLEDVMGARWTLGNEPTAPHLPSFITSCTQKGESFECWSGEYSAHAGSSARTRTKSIIRNGDASGFTIRYRNMITDPVAKRSKWDQDVNQLDCAAQSQNRIRCIETATGRKVIYTRVTGDQFSGLFTLSALAATKWYSGGQPAVYLPSSSTRCNSEGSGLVCWSAARTVQSTPVSSSIKTKSLIRKTGNGTFLVTYRNLVTTDGQGTWEQESRDAHCRVMSFERIVCEDEKGTRSYAKAVFTL